MKKHIFIIALACLLIDTLSFAQSPEKMSYQAVIRDAENSLVKNQQIGMQISILKGGPDSDAVYTETHTPTTNANGLVSVEVGAGITSGDFSAIDWANGPYFIKTEADPTGGSAYTITGVSQLLSVPYALYAKEAGNVPNISYFPKSGTKFNSVKVSFSGSSTTNFSQASPVALSFGQATPIYPEKIRYANSKNFDAVFYIPSNAATGTYDIIINPSEAKPNILEKAFVIAWD